MSKTNCINCGAAKDTSEIKCPFCGTTYLDLTAIDFASGDPVVCEFMMPFNGSVQHKDGNSVKGKTVMRMLAIPSLDTFTMTPEVTSIYGGSEKLATFTTGMDINVGVSFRPVARKNHPDIEITVVSDNDD